MEDLLLNIVKEATGTKLLNLKQSAQEAYDLLSSQYAGLLRNPAHELRSACFKPLRFALESKRTKLMTLALNGLQKIIRDERFQTGNEPEDDSLWLPPQLLHATASMLTHCEDTQVHILRVFLGLVCGASWTLNGRLVMLLLGRCGEAYEIGTQPVRAAAQAAGSQTVTAFCAFLDEECQDILQQQQKHKNSSSSSSIVYNQTSAVACFNEVIPVMQYICSRLEEARLNVKVNDSTVFLLECLLTLVSTLPQTVHSNTHFTTFLWQRFCPALLSLLGTPGDPTSQALTTSQAKIVYSIGIQLVRLVASEPTLRPVLEALFHRMLLLPGPVRRLEPLRAIKELLRSPGRLADLLLLKNGTQRHAGDDMAIIRLIMDSIEESFQCNDASIMLASVECVVAMLTSLDLLCKGEGISHEGALVANKRYMHLEEADYKGPLTYQSLARLPKPYRDVVANLKYQSDSDSSGIDGGGKVGDKHTDDDDTASDVTEGPEDNASDSDDSIFDDCSFLTSQELQRIQKLPKGLHLGRTGLNECNIDIERHNARHFVKTLQNILLPNLLSLRSSIQLDEILQEFASKCCQHNSAQNFEIKTIMNADGIYLSTYSALLLNLRLIQLGHYDSNNTTSIKVPVTEQQFVEEVYGSGVLVYLSATWLSELYQQVLANSLLESSGYDPNSGQQYALINMLIDIGGLGSNQLLTDWQKLERVHCSPTEPTLEIDAGIKLSRRVLTCCWDSIITVLNGALDETPDAHNTKLSDGAKTLGLLLPRRAKRMQYKKKIRDNLITASLDGLHKAASLSNILKLQSRSSNILSLLSTAACRQSTGLRLHAAHAQSLDVILSKGLALGSHSSACYPHVFSASVHVAKLEHTLFSKAGSAQMLMVAQQSANSVVTSTTTEKLNLSFNLSQDEETCVDVYSFLQSTTQLNNPMQNETSVADIVNKSGAHNTNHGLLSNVDAAKVCCLLSQQVDSLFHEAALKLNLPCLCSFLEELCSSSQRQLFCRSETPIQSKRKWWKRELHPEQKPVATLLLNRIGDVTLKCLRAGRPLIHTMRVWSIVGPHFMEAACHKDRAISKKAITCIHDAVTALLNEQIELPHFHFNEALFKPFENLLCLELCDFDVQDQIVACLCEFVEANRTEICSGWRPLFGTLRVANTSNNNASAIVEVFKIFLSTDNTLVFANAALDYILCLLTHIRGTDSEEVRSPGGGFDSENCKDINLCQEALKYLENCVHILGMMYTMPKCPAFNLSHRIEIDMDPQLVDPIETSETKEEISYEMLSPKSELENCEKLHLTLSNFDNESGVLKIWYILLEGLTSNVVISNRKNQPFVLETLFKLLKDLIINPPGTNFGLYCINHLLLPIVQNWLRQNAKTQKTWENIEPNFKHCCGMTTELIVEYLYTIQSVEDETKQTENPSLTLALKQLVIILIECVAQPNESVARLGTSCFRHILSSSGQILTSNQWEIIVTGIHHACAISLTPLQQLTYAFKPNSDSFYGDSATVKVAARKDCTIEENLKLYQLAQQVLVATQKECKTETKTETLTENQIDDRSYVFLLYPLDLSSTLNPDLYTIRVSFRNFIVGILAHQMLIQTISSALLQNLTHITPIFKILQIHNYSLRGILNKMNSKHMYILLECLNLSSSRAKEFDSRPGLKFLLQKVGNLNQSANLYTQANISDVVQIIVLIELCVGGIERHELKTEHIEQILNQSIKKELITDLDYVETFLIKLKQIWENLIKNYVNLSAIRIESENESESEPFKFSDFITEPEQEQVQQPDETGTNENHLEIDKETEMKVEAMMEQYRKRKPYNALPAMRINPFNEIVSIPPPEPVPVEIQQQRVFSIRKDAEYYKVSYIETIEACLELLGSLTAERLRPLAILLENGANLLANVPDEKIVNASQLFIRKLQP